MITVRMRMHIAPIDVDALYLLYEASHASQQICMSILELRAGLQRNPVMCTG